MGIQGKTLYGLILSGANNIVVNENLLNKINVYPVPDGDTGTNLSLTMNQILLEAKEFEHVFMQIENIAEIALKNAYGNSGMIFAEYLSGMSDSLINQKEILKIDLIKAFKNAYSKAHKSVAQPKEGTILSVMKIWSELLETSIHDELEHLFNSNLEKLYKSVENTKNQMKILRDNNVVDAGAMAFFFFIEGMTKFLKNGLSMNLEFKASKMELISEPLKSLDIGAYRYCCQYQVKGNIDVKELEKEINPYGDSIVIHQDNSNISIHMHANDPAMLMQKLLSIGPVLKHKIDDMYLQTHMKHKPKSKIAILTDSIADIPSTLIDDNQVAVLPLNIIIDSIVYKDKITMTADYFYNYLDDFRLSPTSSQPNTESIERYLKQILNNYDEVIGIFVSSEMSGTYSNILKALDKLDTKNKKIKIIDSKSNSAAQGLIVYETVLKRNEGLNFDDLVEYIERLIEKSEIFVSVKDLKYMIKGGRVSKVTGQLLSFIKLKPVISIDKNGKGIIPYKTLSQKSAINAISKKLSNDMKEFGISKYSLVYADNEIDLSELKRVAEEIIGKKPEYVECISPIVGLNAGKGAFAIAYLKNGVSK